MFSFVHVVKVSAFSGYNCSIASVSFIKLKPELKALNSSINHPISSWYNSIFLIQNT